MSMKRQTREGLILGGALAIGAVALVLVLVGAARAETESLEEMMLRRIAWIEEHTEFVYDGQPLPEIALVPGEIIHNMIGSTSARAAFDPFSMTIYLNDELDPMSLDAAFVVVHELVHFLQWVEEPYEFGDCVAPREMAAYKAHLQFQEEFGPWPADTNMLFVYFVSQCPEGQGRWDGPR